MSYVLLALCSWLAVVVTRTVGELADTQTAAAVGIVCGAPLIFWFCRLVSAWRADNAPNDDYPSSRR